MLNKFLRKKIFTNDATWVNGNNEKSQNIKAASIILILRLIESYTSVRNYIAIVVPQLKCFNLFSNVTLTPFPQCSI